MKYLVSIIIATKDRYETLFDCVRGLLINYSGPECQIVVRDNSSSGRPEEFLAEFGALKNISYVFDPKPVSQSENYELALTQALGKFVTMIGDDDGIAHGLLVLANWMDSNGYHALLPGSSVYLWPGVRQRFSAERSAGLLFFDENISGPQVLDVSEQRANVLQLGCTSLGLLPRLYYGLISWQVLRNLRVQAGRIFPGPSPDMANAFAVSYFVERFAVAKLPIFISGNSSKSNAALGLRARHVGNISDIDFLPRDTAQTWNSLIPFFWSGQTIWCQSAATAAQALSLADSFLRENNFVALYAKLLVFQPKMYRPTFSALTFLLRNKHGWKRLRALGALVGNVVAVVGERGKSFVLRRLRTGSRSFTLYDDNCMCISEATRRVDVLMKTIDITKLMDSASDGSSEGNARGRHC